MIFLEDFIAMNSPLELAPRQQTSYSSLYYDFTLLSLYVILSSVKFFSLLKRMHLVLLHQNGLIIYYQQTNRTHLKILYLKQF